MVSEGANRGCSVNAQETPVLASFLLKFQAFKVAAVRPGNSLTI